MFLSQFTASTDKSGVRPVSHELHSLTRIVLVSAQRSFIRTGLSAFKCDPTSDKPHSVGSLTVVKPQIPLKNHFALKERGHHKLCTAVYPPEVGECSSAAKAWLRCCGKIDSYLMFWGSGQDTDRPRFSYLENKWQNWSLLLPLLITYR